MSPEAWLRGPVPGVEWLLQPAAHALMQARDEMRRAANGLGTDTLWARPGGAASVGFHLRHAAGSIDRLLTYTAGAPLGDGQLAALAREADPGTPPTTAAELLANLDRAVERALDVLRSTPPHALTEPRHVGRAKLPTTVLGLLFHIGEHTQRHAGQAITTATVVQPR